MNRKTTMSALVPAYGKIFFDSSFTLTANLRCTIRIHHQNARASFFRFERSDGNELTPTGIMNVFRQTMILDHVLDGQIFKFNRIELFDKFVCFFEAKIKTLALYFSMLSRKKPDRLTSIRPFLPGSPGHSSLRCFQFALSVLDESLVFNSFAGRKSCKRLDAYIDSNCFTRCGQMQDLLLIGSKNHIPTVDLSFNRAGLDGSFDWTAQANTDRADFREIQLVSFETECALHLRESEAIESGLTLEAWVAGLFTVLHSTEEGVKSLAKFAKRVLQNLSVYFRDIFTNGFDYRELDGLRVVVERDAIDLVSISTFLKPRIVKLATNIEPLLKNGFNSLRRLNFELVRLQERPFYTGVSDRQEIMAMKHRNAKFISNQTAQDGGYGWSTLSQS